MTMTQATGVGSETAATARSALGRAARHLLDLQDEQGWWQGELETNVTIDAEDLLLREFLGIRTAEQTDATARWIRSRQRPDGTWSNSYGGKPDLSTTVEAYVALRLAGDSPDAYHMAQAAGWIRTAGGIPATRVFTRIWLALFGEWSWDDLPVMPPELIYLPSWFPLNVSDWACWARQTIVPLTVVGSLRPVRSLPFGLSELRVPRVPADGDGRGVVSPAQRTDAIWARVFGELDRALHVYHRHGLRAAPLRGVRAAAIRRCADWIIARQEKDGCWGGIQPPWVYSLIALHLLGYGLSHPVIERGLAGLDSFTVWAETPEGPVRRIEACQSPVWDTVLAMIALGDAGLPPDHQALVRAGRWVLAQEIRGPGDWQVRRPGLEPSGWAFEFNNDIYPDIDDTAEVLLALERTSLPPDSGLSEAIERSTRWLIGMQSRDGGWGAFDADNTRKVVTKLPFCDFGEVIDPPSADVTAHAVEALSRRGLAGSRPVRRGVAWLLRAQESDGSWFGRWGANYVYGTGAAVPALIAAGVLPAKPVIRRAVSWLVDHQNPDGGWGEDLRSYESPGSQYSSAPGRGESTASQTAWALLALLAAGGADDSVDRGVRWLAQTQRPDGTWDEPQFTGTGFPRDFYINYHLYRLVFPVSALGRYLGGAG
ncbi:MAG TPA: squalene--hopene cyclase [Streptosporangiaceae bacterium]|nr:squalene--hopene cyclase [Streptosporangiaceae bacterium]